MLPRQNFTRIDTLKLKALIVKRIGHQKAEIYFDHLTRFLSSKLNKAEFDKLCIQTLGRDNLPLHNHLIGSIIKNAQLAKVAPSIIRDTRASSNVRNTSNGYQRTSLQSIYKDAFPPSPRKGRSQINRDRKFRDRPSPLGPLGKSPSLISEDIILKAQEQLSSPEFRSIGSKPHVDDGEEVEQAIKIPITAPLGVLNNYSGARKSIYDGSVYNNNPRDTCQYNGELPDTVSLRSRLEQRLKMEGINVSVDCANLLNKGLDTFLKKLIEPCVSLTSSRGESAQFQVIRDSNATLPPRYMHRSGRTVNASLSDFHAAMELNPQILGDDRAVQRERISFRARDEKIN